MIPQKHRMIHMNHLPDIRTLSAADVYRYLPVADCIDALGRAFSSAEGVQSFVGGVVTPAGTFHIKAALADSRTGQYFAAKLNANFPRNRERHGLPTIQGLLLLSSASDGRPLAIMDSASLTVVRTAAATGVVARYAAPPDARRCAVIGCGAQSLAQLEALRAVRPIEVAIAFDLDPGALDAFVAAASQQAGLTVEAAHSLDQCVRDADVIVTCTTARQPFLEASHVQPGTFVAAVGADNPGKNEIAPALMARATVVVDDVQQCAEIGDLHHALVAGVMTRADVWGTVADVIRHKPMPAGRVTIFDSTGVPIEDVAAAAVVYERAVADGSGASVALGS